MKKLVVLSGSGVSAESGLRTFREMGGLWEEYDVYEVASPEGWAANQDLVLRFYNERRKQLLNAQPNKAHKVLASLEDKFDVQIITQNVDNLHERAGSTKVLHLHGELLKSRSTIDPDLIYDIDGWELKKGDTCEKGSQLRPHIVWFGEAVDKIPEAAEFVKQADIFLVIGTSLNVYPAAGLIDFVKSSTEIYLIDPNEVAPIRREYHFIQDTATRGIESFVKSIS
ncbi:MAG: NAD-dependent deacylase [Bacteroidales bacterium]|nr:NAD-dependent deacylase [Bacteroidales bacterium]MCF8389625.1 NAD-dependent deacylase [Bacteroidales bacterium]